MRELNPDKLNELVGKLVCDLGAAIAGAGILLGDRLGIYKAMADGTHVTSSDLAKKTGLHERYLREWLSGQAASGYIDYHADKNTFSLSPEQAMAFAEKARQLSLVAPSISFSPPISMSPRSPRPFVPARASGGMSIRSVFSPATSVFPGRATTLT